MPTAAAIAARPITSLRISLRFDEGMAVDFAGMRCPRNEFDLSLLYHHFQSPRKHIEMFTVKGEDLAVHHDINRSIESEVDVADTMARRERMIQVCAVIKRVKVAQ